MPFCSTPFALGCNPPTPSTEFKHALHRARLIPGVDALQQLAVARDTTSLLTRALDKLHEQAHGGAVLLQRNTLGDTDTTDPGADTAQGNPFCRC